MKTIIEIALISYCLLTLLFPAISQVNCLNNEIVSALNLEDKKRMKRFGEGEKKIDIKKESATIKTEEKKFSFETPENKFLGVVLNQVDTRRSSFQSFENELRFLLADKLFNSKISQLTEIADSPFYAKTVLDFNENSKAKLEFIELSEEIFEKVGL